MESPLALYRRYRPETFAEVIGQEHVTEPLRAALGRQPGQPRLPLLRSARLRQDHQRADPGPRAQLRAGADRRPVRRVRLAAATWPAAARARIDVIEIDAASHGGVDDARDLREKAFFAPGARAATRSTSSTRPTWSRTQGFNALLKLVEEPPRAPALHLRHHRARQGASPTIRSRTHHYPFRLIPPRLLSAYLAELCEQGGRQRSSPAALPLVVRAGGGLGPRHALRARPADGRRRRRRGHLRRWPPALLGYTPDTLLDEVVDAFAAGDGAAVFGGRRQGHRDRPGPAPLRRGPAAPAARPGDRRRGARRARRPG